MSLDDLVRHLKDWVPQTDSFSGPSIAGLAEQLKVAVLAEPDRFAKGASRFIDLRPAYVAAVIDALTSHVKDRKEPMEWAPLLTLCEWVVALDSQQRKPAEDDSGGNDAWRWCRSLIASLLDTGTDATPAALPMELRDQVWSCLEPLTDDPDPTPEDEARHLGGHMTPWQWSFNHVRPKAIHAVVSYALWIRRSVEAREGPQVKYDFSEMPEVQRVLERHLELSNDPSVNVRAVYGEWFPWLGLLDEPWTIAHIPNMFPPTEDRFEHWKAIWNTYVCACPVYDRPFELLRTEYFRAIERMQLNAERESSHERPNHGLANHLLIMYCRGKLDLKDPQGLLRRFLDKATDEDRAHGVELIGRDFGNTDVEIAASIIERVKALWDWRLEHAAQSGDPGELPSFGWVFASHKLGDAWALDRLRRTLELAKSIEPGGIVLEELAKIAIDHPGEVVECVSLIIQNAPDQQHWTISGNEAEIRTILQSALASPNAEIRKASKVVINRLRAKGFWGFGDLLSNTDE